MKLKFFICSIAIATLTACGGGSDLASVPLTPLTQAPVAASADINDRITVPTGAVGFALAQTRELSSTTTASNATGLMRVFAALSDFFIKPAHAQASRSCVTDALKLVGIDNNGEMTELPVTDNDVCDVGFREMFDAGNYVMLTGEGLYKGDLTCNLVFLHKETGKLFCVGESYPSRYEINVATSSSSTGSSPAYSMGGQSASPAAQKLQLVKNANNPGVADYILLATNSTSFDSTGQTNGKKVKLMRFNLKDLEVGPTVQLLAEGLEQNWMQQANSKENLSFTLENYKIARNGDVFAIYSYYLWTQNPWSSTQKRSVNFFTYDDQDVVTVKKVNGNDLQTILDAEINRNRLIAIAQSGNANAYTSSSSNWYTIPCMFDDPESSSSVLITTPYYSYTQTQTGNSNYSYSSQQKSLLIRATGRTGNATVALEAVKPSQLCSDTNAWSGNAPIKVVNSVTGKDVWFTLQTAYMNGYDSGGWYSGQVISLVGNDLTTPRDSNGQPTYVQDDLTVGVKRPTNMNSISMGANDYMDWQKSRTVTSSKDYIYILTKTANYSYMTNVGNTIFRFKPFDSNGAFTYDKSFLDMAEAQPTTGQFSVKDTDSIWVTSLATSPKDNIVNLVGRDLDSDNFEKVFGTIDANGIYTAKPITNSKFTTITIVRI
jgi:hypothetical protein